MLSTIKSRHIWILYILLAAVVLPVYGQSAPGSNIVSRTFLSVDEAKAIEQRVYDNGLGDIVQEVQSYPGSTLPSVIVHHEYDEHRRKTKTWLPVTSSGSDFVSSNMVAFLSQSQYDSDPAPFSRTVYDYFLPSQPAAQYKAGAQWQDNDKKTSATYSEEVGVGMQVPQNGRVMVSPNVKYLCNRTVDEDGCLHAEYTDLNGRVLISETSQGKTYYVYNIKGDISYVFPPALSKYIVENYADDVLEDDDEMMQKYAYIYRYDKQRHCIYKKLPGCAPIYYVYDRTGTLILTQDGEQRPRHEWTFTIPDKFGRPCISGICGDNILFNYATEPLHSKFVYAEYDGTSTQTGGYTVYNLSHLVKLPVLYTATYYDSYSFIGRHGVPSSLTASTVSGFPIDNTLGHGLQTGSATAVISNGSVTGYTYSAMYYDSRYHVAQVKATNHFGGTETASTKYSYTGKPENVRIQHAASGLGTLVQEYTYAYDGADRVSTCTMSVSNGVPALSSTMTYTYDDLGRVSKITRPFTSSTNPDVSYEYDLHGWTKKINTNSFKEELFYADGPGTPRWNGNISSMRWRNEGYNRKRGYKFTYDNAGRLTSGVYGEGDALTTNVNRFSECMGYDNVSGNITAITRYGKTSSNSYGKMDNLTLSYDGYQLTGVTETVADYAATGTFEYKKAKGSQYIYNSNGSLVADKSRGIAYITYDHNSNPSTIYFTNGYMTKYTYSATGQKLSVEHFVAMPNVTWNFGEKPNTSGHQAIFAGHTDYLLGGNLIVQEGKTKRLLFEGGYAEAEKINTSAYGYTLFYYNQDHLGNNREVVNASGTVKQLTNYYPFGAPYADPLAMKGDDLQPYKYNGKELDKTHGLNTYDYGARQYDPILARWDRVDPLAEKYYPYSPYTYCAGDPVNKFDPDGRAYNLVAGGIGAIVGAGINASVAYWEGKSSKEIWGAAAEGAVVGGMAGLTLGASITVAGSSTVGEVAVGALSSGAGNAANQLISQGEIKGGELLNSTIIGGVSGPLSVKGGMLVEKSGANAIKAIESEATSTIANAKNIAYSQVEQTGAKMGGKHAKQQVNKEANRIIANAKSSVSSDVKTIKTITAGKIWSVQMGIGSITSKVSDSFESAKKMVKSIFNM